VGSAEYNQHLSAARALAVKTFLVDVGKVDNTRLSTRGYGFDRPVTTNETEEGRAQNRRVAFAGSIAYRPPPFVEPEPVVASCGPECRLHRRQRRPATAR
jgi:hypothetical protein